MELYRSFTTTELKMLLNGRVPVTTGSGSERCWFDVCSDGITRLGALNGRCVSASVFCHITEGNSVKIGHVAIDTHPPQAD